MSRKGNKIIQLPANVNVNINKDTVVVSSASGSLTVNYPNVIKVEKVTNGIKVTRANDEKQTRMYHGTVNSNIANAIKGLHEGFKKVLKITGVGYKAAVANGKLTLAIGFSHPVIFDIPKDLHVSCTTPTEINISGFNKELVGEFTANVRAIRKPEPYNGKGIAYSDEIIIRKVGKTAEGAGAAAAPAKK
jgi:large subunit ribosomal protein L6